MSIWDQHDIEIKIRQILGNVASNPNYRTLGRQFLTTYQIVLDFNRRFGPTVAAIGKPLGGQGTGPDALTIYFAGELAKRISDGRITDIEMQFLAPQDIDTISFVTLGPPMVATPHQAGFPNSMFRLRT
jgi:hypothetical protein